MKNLLLTFTCMALIIATSINAGKISDYLASKIGFNQKLIIEEKDEYAKDDGYLFVKTTDNFIPYSYQDLLDIVYSTINNGWESFTFYCPNEYTECINDMETISNDEITLTHINNYVHPYNSFNSLKTKIMESGEINISINYVYTKDQIDKINTEVKRIMNLVVKKDNSDYENIKALHDYIINNTKYDEEKTEFADSKYASSIAYGALFEHYATCNGYTDTMAIFMSLMGIKNYKIATTKADLKTTSTGHVWNAVYLDGKWLHMDLTWDDPVSTSGEDYLYHKYFLVTTEQMHEADDGEIYIEEHNFNKNVYLEFNEKSEKLA